MGKVLPVDRALYLAAVFSCHDQAFDWVNDWLERTSGPIALRSPRFEFTETDYYQESMGDLLQKQFFACERLIDPGVLPDLKLAANEAECEFRQSSNFDEPRPLNIDPGYITLSKLVLASTKNHAHRIYLRDGIFAEITLRYRGKKWQPWDWTYPDYRRADVQNFFEECRAFLHARLSG